MAGLIRGITVGQIVPRSAGASSPCLLPCDVPMVAVGPGTQRIPLSDARAVLARSWKMPIRELVTILYFFLTIYSFSGGAVQGIANYSSWKLIGAEDFPAVHKFVNHRIFLVYVPLFLLSVLTNIALIWFHHPAVSTTLVVIAAVLNLFIWIITATMASRFINN